jgi:tetratricopeptide (TPR) repeat protein
MRDHDEEHSILLELADRLEERPVLVTFNGKCFDWPLLQNRFRMTRQIDPPSFAAHLDLLHPARQLWRLQVGSVRLADLEQHVLGAESLGWSRRNDIDSSRIPEFYFEFLRGIAIDGITGVFQHNRMDLRGLAALAGRIFQLLSEPERGERSPLELYGISRLLNLRAECSKARRVYERCLGTKLPEPIARRAKHEAAKLAKRERDFDRAIELWDELARSPEPSLEALEQLAIYYERRARDYGEAGRLSGLALAELGRACRMGLITPKHHERLSTRIKRRLTRLEPKLTRAGVTSHSLLRNCR